MELQALQNFATRLGLSVHLYYYEDKRKKDMFYLTSNGTTISPKLNYNELNAFMLGYSSAVK